MQKDKWMEDIKYITGICSCIYRIFNVALHMTKSETYARTLLVLTDGHLAPPDPHNIMFISLVVRAKKIKVGYIKCFIYLFFFHDGDP